MLSDERLLTILKREAHNHGPEDYKHQVAVLLGNIVMELEALRARHNALVEAVAWHIECERNERRQFVLGSKGLTEASDSWAVSLAEVDRLIDEGEG